MANEEEQSTVSDLSSEKKESSGESKIGKAAEKASQIKDRAKKVADIAKKVSKNGAAKIGKVIAQIASKLGPALPYVAIAVVVLFIIIGICGFLATMPGLLTGKLKAMAQSIADWWQGLYKTSADATVNEENIIEAAEYIRSMGYDLIGYGFIPANKLEASKLSGETVINDEGKYIDSSGNEVSNPGKYYDKYGIQYTTGGDEEGADGTFETAGQITGFLDDCVDTKRLRTYCLADARLFSIRNYDNTESVLSWIHDIFVKNDEDWSKGLISLYVAKDFIATEEYSELDAGYIKVNPTTKQMEIKRGWNTNSMKFAMDGWTGRYGMTLEFLLSLHLATMAPELVSTMARTFDTEVQVYLDEASQKITGYYKDETATDYVSYQDILDSDGRWIGNKDAYDIMKKYNIKSREEGVFACSKANLSKIFFINGTSGNKDTTGTDETVETLEELTTGEQKAKVKDMFKFEGDDKIPGSSWKDFLTNYKDLYQEDSEEGTGCSWANNINAIAYYVNTAINWIEADKGGTCGLTGDWWVEDAADYDGLENIRWKDYKNKIGLGNIKFTRTTSHEYTIHAPDNYSITDWDNFATKLEKIMPFKEFSTLQKGTMEEFNFLTLRSYQDPTNPDCIRYRFSIVVFRTSGDSNCNLAVVCYREPSIKEKNDPETCSESSGPNACQNCENYVQTIRDALYDITENGQTWKGELKTYIPYIARVVDSWFRDTYFIVPNDSGASSDVAIQAVYSDVGKNNDYGGTIKLSGKDIDFIEVDNEYLEKTDEYWTKYETTTNSKGETVYVLYVLKPNGTLDTSKKYIRDVDSEGREVYKNLASGDTELVETSDLKLVKKNTKSTTIDVGWNSKGNVWTAYTQGVESGKSDYYELEVHSQSPKDIRKVTNYTASGDYDKYFYYQYTDRIYIEQTEDGRRGITNPTIKKMFKIRKYYIYDGSEERAQAIYKDWKNILSTHGANCESYYKSKVDIKYKDSPGDVRNERAVEYALDDYYYNDPPSGYFASSGDPRNKSLIGNITINKDTLNAFSILENTHTLDADYQYRDFKELIVELDYFDKEDLSDKAEEIFEWIIPEYANKWPLRLIDKSEQYYGTLVHSDKGVEQLKTDLGLTTSTSSNPTGSTTPAADPKQTELANATGYTTGLNVVSPVAGEVISYGKYKRDNTDLIKAKSIEYGTEETAKTLKQKGIDVEEEVGFIQIKVLDEKSIALVKSACGSAKISNVEYEDEDGNKKTIDIEEYKAWDGYYKEYEDVCEGYVITIEGIELLYNGTDALSQLISNASSLTTEDINPKVTPNLADDNLEMKNQQIENAKVKLGASKTVVDSKGKTRLYIREGTIIGKTTYSTNSNLENYSYMRLILRDAKLAIVENVENYFDLPEGVKGGPQTYAMATGDLDLLAHMIYHEGTPGYFQGRGLTQELAQNAAKATAYVLINRAKSNYGNYGTTLIDQLMASGQYDGAAQRYSSPPTCGCTSSTYASCLEIAEYCLTYDCSSITNGAGEPMPSNVYGQSGFCHNGSSYWWHIDTVKNGRIDCASSSCSNYSGNTNTYDAFFAY